MKVLMAGGGTGGHVYPALAMAKALRDLKSDVEVHFVGTSQGVEKTIVPKAGYPLHLVEVGRLNRNVGWGERLRTVLKMPWSLLKAFILIWKLNPDLVVGVGGYASGPALLVAALLRRKTVIWEPNAYPGLANRVLAPFVDLAIVVFPSTKDHMKAKRYVQMAMPVREEIENAPPRVPTTADFCVLVFGGSQGARRINEVMKEALDLGGDWLKGVRFIHQVGSADFAASKKFYDESVCASGHVDCREYIEDMPSCYNWADIVVCRAGTGTLSELAAMGKPAILVPLPSAADDHQRKNAESMAGEGAAKVLLQENLNPDSLKAAICEFKDNPSLVDSMGEAARRFHQPQAAKKLARFLIDHWEKN